MNVYLFRSVGHKSRFGHEFLEFELRPDGRLRYANNSNYKRDVMIRKEMWVNEPVLNEVRRIVEESNIVECVHGLASGPCSACGRIYTCCGDNDLLDLCVQ